MGGGPRTFPGGVSKWQWKRMQAKKARQLLKARLARERQIYEMRKRAELKAAVSELERPWETVERPPNLFSVTADEQLKVLADRFQKPGGLDLWSENDGPQLFRPDNGLPSARFFPKGVVHSIKPYGKIEDRDRISDESSSWGLNQNEESGGSDKEMGIQRRGYFKNSRSSNNGGSSRRSNPTPNSEKGVVRDDKRRNLDEKIRDTKHREGYEPAKFNKVGWRNSRYQKHEDENAEIDGFS